MMSGVAVHGFYFEWPGVLILLLLIPLWWGLFAGQERRKWQQAMRFSYASLVAHLKLQPAGWRRLMYPLAVSLVLACLVTAMARPVVVGRMPVRTLDMMIVMDISLSMLAEDIEPDRFTAARDAAVRFIDSLPRDVRVGLEVFAGDSRVLSAPTRNHREVTGYLRQLRKEDLRERTEIGSAIRTAMTVMLPPEALPGPGSLDSPEKPMDLPEQVMILMSDGDSHEGYPWPLAAQEARDAHITIHTVGIGRDLATTIMYQGMELPVLFSETTLRNIAEITGGQYFRVAGESDFRGIYDQIRERSIRYEERSLEVGFIPAALALLLLLGITLRGGRL